ncbi:phosphoadenosine phosphosulfate reductase domain-containing protein [Anaerotignum sp.]|uniref:phosphoadenosine phosphosulfate reductase domain-containing protein n=1 Tax=Anaerotignum sp. TaxID=2039241 RepID=UPI002897C4FA|nr:phosphoadenosine phosphosulfate reductase family protein [Anaerotignum sp.]
MFMNFSNISKEQKKSLDYKIEVAVREIKEGFSASKYHPAIAFSGGKDSTGLWHLIKTHFPEKQYYIIFGNTGVEFPESLNFARKLGEEWGGDDFFEAQPEKLKKDELKYEAQCEVLKWLEDTKQLDLVLKKDGKLKSTGILQKVCPAEMYEDFKRRNLIWKAGTRKNYFWCADQYGYPILGKAVSGKLTARRINIDCFLKYSTSASDDPELLEYYDLLRQVKISNHCCAILKKEPSEKLQAKLMVDVIFKGLMACESQMRNLNFATRGYLFQSKRPHCGDFFHCSPIAIWTDDDIWEYIHRYDVPYSPLYDIEYEDEKGRMVKIKRNGCVGCATDIAFKNNHMAALRKTHPRLWKGYMLKTGLGNEIMKLHRVKGSKISKMDYFKDAEQLGEISPCAFDDIGIVNDKTTMSEYDGDVD